MISYNVYSNGGTGGPIDYQSPVATVTGATWAFALPAPGEWSFGVRAFDENGEEENLDCSAMCAIDANGDDVTGPPLPPMGLRAFALPAGAVRAEWWWPASASNGAPLGFHVFLGPEQGPPTAEAPAATVPYGSGAFGMFSADLNGLEGGTTYLINVRAFNKMGLEGGAAAIAVTAGSLGPAPIDGLTSSLIV